MNKKLLKNAKASFLFLILIFSFMLTPLLHANQTNTESYDLLIITPDIFKDELEPLVEHKNRIGISTKLVTLSKVYDESHETDFTYLEIVEMITLSGFEISGMVPFSVPRNLFEKLWRVKDDILRKRILFPMTLGNLP